MNTTNASDVTTYIHDFDGEARLRLEQLRVLIHKLAPTAVEFMSYGMPAYKLNGKTLIYFAAYKHHLGLYPGKIENYDFNPALQAYTSGKSTLQFKHSEPLPLPLISEFITYRIKQLK